MKIFVFGDNDEADKQRALADALRMGNVGDADAAKRQAQPEHERTDAVPAVPDAPSAAGMSVQALLDSGLTVADVQKLLADEQKRRDAIEAERARQRDDLLRSDAERARLARMTAERERLTPLLADVERQILEATAQFMDERDALLMLAGQLNVLDVRHARLFGQLVDVTAHPVGEFPARKRCHIWHTEHAITLEQLRRASVE